MALCLRNWLEQISKLLPSVRFTCSAPLTDCLPVLLLGGIKSTNLLRTLHGTISVSNRALDGVAIVSDIVASPEPRLAARRLQTIFSQFQQYNSARPLGLDYPVPLTIDLIMSESSNLMTEIRKQSPLVHQVHSELWQFLEPLFTFACIDHEYSRRHPIRECHACSGSQPYHGYRAQRNG